MKISLSVWKHGGTKRLKLLFLFTVVPALLLSQPQNRFHRFAWLSDTHVSPTTSGAKDLTAAVLDINARDSIDFVLVSGDITDLNVDSSLARAKHILDRLQAPYYIIPGNHDTKWTDCGNYNFKKFWGNDKFIFNWAGFTFIGMHQGPVLRMADGHFAPEDLHWLDSLLQTLPPERPLIMVNHYPTDQSVDNFEAYLNILKGHNVKLFLNGHGHRNRKDFVQGVPQIMDRSSLHKRDRTGGYNLVRLRGDSLFFSERLSGLKTKAPWAVVALHRDFRPFRFPGFTWPEDSVNSQYPDCKPVWQFDTGHLMLSAPLVRGRYVFIADAGGMVRSLDLNNGDVHWQVALGGAVYATPAESAGRLVVSSMDSCLYCLDSETGKLIWKVKTGRPVEAVPLIYDGKVFVGGSDHIFRCILLKDGSEIWRYSPVKGYVEDRPVLAEGKVIFGAWDKTLYALNGENGQLAWKWQGGRNHVLYSPAACWPVASGNKVFIAAPDRFLTALDIQKGDTLWRSDSFKVRESLGISEDGQRIYAKCMNDTVFAVNARAASFQPLWVRNFGYGYDFAPAMLTEKQGTVYLGTKNGMIISFEGKSGRLNWKHVIGHTLINTPAAVDSMRVVVGNMDGKVVLLKEE